MSANYWESSQRRHWLFTKEQLAAQRAALEEEGGGDLVRRFPLPGPRHRAIFFCQLILRLGKRLRIRQQAVATAQVYLKRFYTRVEIRRTNPYLFAATAAYLACKMEESPQHIRMILAEARQLWPDFIAIDSSRIGECEFWLISEMNSQLIIHQPYRSISSLRVELGLVEDDVQLAKSIINDHYMTDLPLLCDPHVVALSALLLAFVLRPSVASTTTAGATSTTTMTSKNANMGGSGGQANSSSLAGAMAITPIQARSVGQAVADAVGLDPSGPSQDNKEKKQVQDLRIARVRQFAAWLADSTVDIAAMVDATQEMISFYECYEQYNEKLTREQVNRFIKTRLLDK